MTYRLCHNIYILHGSYQYQRLKNSISEKVDYVVNVPLSAPLVSLATWSGPGLRRGEIVAYETILLKLSDENNAEDGTLENEVSKIAAGQSVDSALNAGVIYEHDEREHRPRQWGHVVYLAALCTSREDGRANGDVKEI